MTVYAHMGYPHTVTPIAGISPAGVDARDTAYLEDDVVASLADLTAEHGPLMAARMLFAPEVLSWPAPSSLSALARLRRPPSFGHLPT